MSGPEHEGLVGIVLAGRYEVTGVLGSGGMGVVLEARQLAVGRQVAIKLLHPRLGTNRQAVARFMREMQVTSRLEHPSTVRVYDFGEAEVLGGTGLFLVMELVRGRTLGAVLSEVSDAAGGERMSHARVVGIALQIARALEAAHGEGIVHRDLKPDNVMLVDRYGQRDVVKVLDFGIARFVEGAEGPGLGRLTREGAVVGTPAYMSPEQATGSPLSAASDIYSFGVMLFEMATGVVPFSAPTTVSLMVKHVQEAPPRPSDLAELPNGLEKLILACMEKEPERRPASARALVEALEAIGRRLGGDAGAGGELGEPGEPSDMGDLRPDNAEAARARALAADTARGAEPPVAEARAADSDVAPPPRGRGRWLAWAAGSALVAGAVVVAAVMALGAQDAPKPRVMPAATLALAGDTSDDDTAAVVSEADDAGVSDAPHAAASDARTTGEPPAPSVKCAQLVSTAQEALAKSAAEAREAARVAVERCPDWAVAHVTRGQAEQADKAWDAAREAFARAQALAPGWGLPRFDRALVELAAGRPAEAEAILTELLAIAPEWPNAHLLRAQANLGLGAYAAARADAEAATAASPERAEAWFLLGESHRALGAAGSPEVARQAYCKAQSLGMAAAAVRCAGP